MFLLYPTTDSPTASFTAAAGQPQGTTYQWSFDAGADKATIIGDDTGASATVQGTNPSVHQGDVHVKLTYSNGGSSGSWTAPLTVCKPTRPMSTRVINAAIIGPTSPGLCWIPVDYEIKEQFWHLMSGLLWDETWTILPDDPGLLTHTFGGCHFPDGTGTDHIGWDGSGNPACLLNWQGTDTLLFHWAQKITLGGWHGWNDPVWTNSAAAWDTPNIAVNATN